MSLEKVRPIIECGYARKKGDTAAFSDGEISFRPTYIEGTAVVDGPVAFIGELDKPVTMELKKGRVIKVSGGSEARKIKDWLGSVKGFNNIAEIGIGLNPCVRRGINFEEAKKGIGSIHIALGDDIFYHGDNFCQLHVDMVIYDVRISFDDPM